MRDGSSRPDNILSLSELSSSNRRINGHLLPVAFFHVGYQCHLLPATLTFNSDILFLPASMLYILLRRGVPSILVQNSNVCSQLEF